MATHSKFRANGIAYSSVVHVSQGVQIGSNRAVTGGVCSPKENYPNRSEYCVRTWTNAKGERERMIVMLKPRTKSLMVVALAENFFLRVHGTEDWHVLPVRRSAATPTQTDLCNPREQISSLPSRQPRLETKSGIDEQNTWD